MHFLITAGGTREYIDPVRFISNASSGKMGYCLAEAAIKARHKVTLISAPVGLLPPKGVKIIKVETAAQMLGAVRKNFKTCDCLIMAAAVSDYTPIQTEKLKIKKCDKNLILKLRPTTDILEWAGSHKRNQIIVGFALEDKNIRKRAEEKLRRKNLDIIIANTPAAIGADKSTLLIKTTNTEWKKFAAETKTASARKIISLIDNIRS